MDERPTLSSTWRALAAPRRAVPLAAVTITLLVAEWGVSGSAAALALDAVLVALFGLVAPAAWRAASRSSGGGVAHAAYVLACALVVATVVLAAPLLGLRGTYVVDPPAIGLLVVLFAVGGWGLGRDIDLERGIESAERRAEKNALDAAHARLLALRAQLDPHFLFNTLNAIAEWCREDPLLAEQATLKLASMLRAILEGVDVASWPLAREIALLDELAALYALRDGERYLFERAVPSVLPDVDVPPMIALPLLENAITHGPAAGHVGVVRLSVDVRVDAIVIAIDNPGAFTGRREGGRGIAMVERRLALAYGTSGQVRVRADGDRTRAELTLPRPHQFSGPIRGPLHSD